MDLGLRGKRVFVQGASTGLGYAIAKGFATEGAHVAICSSNSERAEKAALEIGAKAWFALNLDHPGAGERFIHEGVKKLGGIDVLITNTGGPKKAYFRDLSMKDWEEGFRRLWMSAVESIHAAAPFMKKQKSGRILLLTSTAAKEPISGLTLSNSFRPGLLGLVKSLSRELAPDAVTVNSVMPGYTKTEKLAEIASDETVFTKQIPMGRLANLDEIAALFLFLASEKASYLTGQAIACDGGLLYSS